MKILLIRLRLIGDVVFTTPIPRALKREFPGCRVEYLVEESAAPVLAGNTSIDELLVIPRSRGLRRILDDLGLAQRLRRKRFDLVIDLHGGPRSSWLTLATGAPQRIGYAIAGRRWMYTKAVPRARELRARHSVVNQWDLLEAIGGWRGGTADAGRDAVEMPVDPAADARVGARLTALGVTAEHELILAHVSAGNPFRRWPEPAFVASLTELAAANDRRRIIVSSGPSDRDAATRISTAVRSALGERRSRLLDFGEFDLPELRALISRSRAFIGGDTGPLHIAATSTTPVVGLYGPTLPARSAPWRDRSVPTVSLEVDGLPCRPCEQRVCEPGDFRCLTRIRPEQVIAAAESVMR
jgi:lipopolysaccharide heptosyltransferase II